ncbi:hypothetical protein PSCICO_45830 [Pseudomonas cichorii]|uniref:hypothetical protein n=1 Tax=Pseudomonas cichorii TaxID=36746 RepID=UPI001910E817|nr:hypothetical protein [Pseudomonas cichorii]GFM89184.1 hypothetical protein PSCICO_45830 [Pseudomonas cichorii]
MKTNTVLRLGRIQYRKLADLTKQAGCCLGVSTFEKLGKAWGLFSIWPSAVHVDVSVDGVSLEERTVLQVAARVNTARLRAVQRPEIDWSQLEDHEIFEFIVQHEIGHSLDNHFVLDLWGITDPHLQDKCHRIICRTNEVLADRYAWNQIRPGEPVPLCENGKRIQEDVAESMALLDLHVPRTRRTPRALACGQYTWVPQSMLLTDELTDFIGPGVSPALIQRDRAYCRDTRSTTGR